MYAIIETSGKQIKVAEKDLILVNKYSGNEGDRVEFDKVLLIKDKDTQLGDPYIKNAKVIGIIKRHKKGKKILIGKHKRRKNYQKINGFRHYYTEILIDGIKG